MSSPSVVGVSYLWFTWSHLITILILQLLLEMTIARGCHPFGGSYLPWQPFLRTLLMAVMANKLEEPTAGDQSCILKVPYLPVYKSIPCISRPPIFDGKKRKNGTLILYSSISGNVDTQKNQGLKCLIVLLFNSCCICGHFVLEFRKSSQKIEHVNLQVTCFVVQG